MLLTNLKSQNSKLKTAWELGSFSTIANGAGFTFIEMIVAISILGIVALIGTGFLLTSLSSSGKAEINKEVRQNGNFALSIMEGLIISAENISCPTADEIDVIDINGQLTKFICYDSAPDYKISSVSSTFSPPTTTTYILTADNVAVTDCNFTCTTIVGNPTTVGIGFTVSQVGSSGRPSEKSSVSFQTQVSTRNY